MIPTWYGFILLFLAAWRSWHLLAYDDILNWPRRYVTAAGNPKVNADGVWTNKPKEFREGLADWIECPYCSGWWVAIGWYGAFLIWPHGTTIAAVFCALGAGVVAAHKFLSS